MNPIVVRHDNVWGQITERLPNEAIAYIDSKTKYHPVGYDKTWNFKKRRWDGFNHCFDMQYQRFRVGLLPRILSALEFCGFKPTLDYIGSRGAGAAIAAQLPDGIVRSYDFQAKVRQVVRDEERGIIVSPTGTGKTIMAALMIDELKIRTLVILNDLVLLDQMERSLIKRFPDASIGYIGASEFKLGDITVATVQSLRSILGIENRKNAKESPNRGDLERHLERVGVIIHDEAHLADAETCVAVYTKFPNANRIYGFSATPYGWADKTHKSTNVELEQVFGGVIYDTSKIDFIELGLKVPLVVKSVQVQERMKTYGTFHDNQAELYKKALKWEITENEEWISTIEREVREFNAHGMSCFVYASHSLEYGQKLADRLNAPFVQGKTPRKERFRIFDAVQAKETLTIVSDIGGVGLDIPSLDVFVLGSDSKDIRQMKGRVERGSPDTGKKSGTFVDLWKDCSFLHSHRKTRLNQYKQNGDLVL